jgi:hypothetical protein
MAHYEVVKYTVAPIDGADQIEVVIYSSDGNKWEYGIPFNRASGRYQFPEIDVLEVDFGEEFARELRERIEAAVEAKRR